jgi:predicted short-subunit dehydrogenase-like oxidoreductase (DUF2520 family)
MKRDPDNLILLGAGNLAWHMGPALQDAGYRILQVFSRSADHAGSLAERLGTGWAVETGDLNPEAGTIVFCVSDRAIAGLLDSIALKDKFLVHTAGSIPAEVFRGHSGDYGVLYPVMTFTKGRFVDFSGVPLCIEGNNPESTALLEKMAGKLSRKVCRMDSAQRRILHLAGVLASNFSNHMYRLSGELLGEAGVDFELLRPLILETAGKVMEMNPEEAQTGPAARSDDAVMREHIELLKDRPELQKIYIFVTESIRNHSRIP